MSTTPVARTQLGDALLNGTWWLDVNTGTSAGRPSWTGRSSGSSTGSGASS